MISEDSAEFDYQQVCLYAQAMLRSSTISVSNSINFFSSFFLRRRHAGCVTGRHCLTQNSYVQQRNVKGEITVVHFIKEERIYRRLIFVNNTESTLGL